MPSHQRVLSLFISSATQWMPPAALCSRTRTTRWCCPRWRPMWRLGWAGGLALGWRSRPACLTRSDSLDSLNGEAMHHRAQAVRRQTQEVRRLFRARLMDSTAWFARRYRLSPAIVQAVVADSLARVGLLDFADRPVATLSGGQKQRVAIAGALAEMPRVGARAPLRRQAVRCCRFSCHMQLGDAAFVLQRAASSSWQHSRPACRDNRCWYSRPQAPLLVPAGPAAG